MNPQLTSTYVYGMMQPRRDYTLQTTGDVFIVMVSIYFAVRRLLYGSRRDNKRPLAMGLKITSKNIPSPDGVKQKYIDRQNMVSPSKWRLFV